MRVVRILTYEGSEDWIKASYIHSWIQWDGGAVEMPRGQVITSIVDEAFEFPFEEWRKEREKREPNRLPGTRTSSVPDEA